MFVIGCYVVAFTQQLHMHYISYDTIRFYLLKTTSYQKLS